MCVTQELMLGLYLKREPDCGMPLQDVRLVWPQWETMYLSLPKYNDPGLGDMLGRAHLYSLFRKEQASKRYQSNTVYQVTVSLGTNPHIKAVKGG